MATDRAEGRDLLGSRATRQPIVTRRNLLVGSGTLLAGAALYSSLVSRHEISVITRNIPITDLPPAFQGYRVVQLSDFHLDEYTEPFFLEEVVAQVNRLAPDLVLLTGDYITRGSLTFVLDRRAAHRCAEILSTINCAQKFCILGNHDVAVNASMVTQALQARGLPVLRNSYETITVRGDSLHVGGTADPVTDIPDLSGAVPAHPSGPVLVMIHAPDYVDSVREHPSGHLVDLMLSGHTHGGQIRLPILGATILPPLGQKYVQGHFQFGALQLYVNRGLGTVGLPARWNCPPEISLFTLQHAT